jgi:imidazolonepropionase-like amidohydrolase
MAPRGWPTLQQRSGLGLRAVRDIVEIAVAILIGVAGIGSTASAVNTGGRPLLIRNVRIFDGTRIIDANSVAVADGKIVAVGTNVTPPPGAQVMDGSGDALLPGLIDSHVHIWIRPVLEAALVMGVTTVLDMYMRWDDAQRWRAEEARGAADIADFRTAGTAIAVAGGHGTESSLPPMTPIRGPAEAQTFVDERIAHGSDFIKVFYDNGPGFAAMSKDTLVTIVRAAHARHKKVIVHCASAQGALDVIDSGADGLAHVPIVKLPEPAFRNALAAHHIFAITTLGFTDFFFGRGRLWSKLPDDPALGPFLSPSARLDLEQPAQLNVEHISYADNEADLRTLRDIGVPLLAGTDANDAQAGATLHTELELMVNAGLTPAETLADATSVPARVFGLDDRGTIAPGKRADLLLVRGDPTRDIRTTRDIVAIWKQGVGVDRERYRDTVAQENAAWRFGPGWRPWTDSIFKGSSQVRVNTVAGGPNHARATMIVSGDVNPGIAHPWAGVVYFPALSYRRANGDISASPKISFRIRGEGKTYELMLFRIGKTIPATKTFTAPREWTQVAVPFSALGCDGRDVSEILLASDSPGAFRFELSDAHPGARRWLGMELEERPLGGVRINAIDADSPALRAGLRAGEKIVAFAGQPVEDYPAFARLLLATHIHDKVPIVVVRGSQHRTATIEVGERPAEVHPLKK